MSRKIATPEAVFNACENLELSGKTWNRDDVRHAVGGGGYNVIDPLIQAWRKLKPVKEIASTTPTELLFQIAQSLESHFNSFIQDGEQREMERTQIFKSTVEELSEKINQLEEQSESLMTSNKELTEERARQNDLIENFHSKLTNKESEITELQTRNDELIGLTHRLEKQLADQSKEHKATLKTLENKHETRIDSLIKEHKTELIRQKEELIKQGELNENRLMRLLDQERTDSKKQREQQNQKLEELRQREQDSKERIITLTTECQHLRDNLDTSERTNDKLNDRLANEQSRYDALLKKRNETSELEELKSTILALKDKLE